MIPTQVANTPKIYGTLLEKSEKMGFTMPSDIHIGALLRALVASRPQGNFLELGTGVGLSLSWMVDGLGVKAHLTSLDNDQELVAIATSYFKGDKRVTIQCADGALWLKNYKGEGFDLIFADAWPGKYSYLDNALELLKPGGFYVIDDMKRQENWPNGHQEKATALLRNLEQREDLVLTIMDWSTGIVIGVKKLK